MTTKTQLEESTTKVSEKFDFIATLQPEPFIQLASGLKVALVCVTINAKKNYLRLKDSIMLKGLAEQIWTESYHMQVIEKEAINLRKMADLHSRHYIEPPKANQS